MRLNKVCGFSTSPNILIRPYIYGRIKTYLDCCHKKKTKLYNNSAFNRFRSSHILNPHTLSSVIFSDRSILGTPYWGMVSSCLFALSWIFSTFLKSCYIQEEFHF